MCQLDFTLSERIRIDGEVVVVRRDLDLPCLKLLYWVVSAVMSKLQFEGFSAESNPDKLMPQADAENRLPSHEPADRIHRVCTRLRIARTVRKKNSVRLQGQHVFRRSLRRDYRHFAALAAQLTQNVLLDPEVVGYHVKSRRLILYSYDSHRLGGTFAPPPHNRGPRA